MDTDGEGPIDLSATLRSCSILHRVDCHAVANCNMQKKKKKKKSTFNRSVHFLQNNILHIQI